MPPCKQGAGAYLYAICSIARGAIRETIPCIVPLFAAFVIARNWCIAFSFVNPRPSPDSPTTLGSKAADHSMSHNDDVVLAGPTQVLL